MSQLEAAWQAALGAEHQAVFGYALAGARLSGSDRALAMSCSDAHATIRDAMESAIAMAGLIPATPEADYSALYPVPDAPAARRLAVRLEDACAQAWRYLYARTVAATGSRARTLRAQAQQQLIGSAVRATKWRELVDPARATTPFPGI